MVLIGTTDLCMDMEDKVIRIDIYRSEAGGFNKLLGSIDGITLGDLKETAEPEFEMTIPPVEE